MCTNLPQTPPDSGKVERCTLAKMDSRASDWRSRTRSLYQIIRLIWHSMLKLVNITPNFCNSVIWNWEWFDFSRKWIDIFSWIDIITKNYFSYNLCFSRKLPIIVIRVVKVKPVHSNNI